MTLLLTMQRRQELALAMKTEFDLESAPGRYPMNMRKKGEAKCCRCRVGRSRKSGRSWVLPERVLNHQKKRMKRVYDRFAYSRQKRDALEKWAKYLSDLLAEAQGEKVPVG
jgi:hypothetical protein